MKILSVTRDEGRVVELTRSEFVEFAMLAKAIEGKEEGQAYNDFAVWRGAELKADSEIDFQGVFGAIQAFYTAHFRLNELTRLVDEFRQVIAKGGPK